MKYRKTLPLDNVLNRLNAKAVSHRMTAANIRRDADGYSTPERAEISAQQWEAQARELELMALEVMEWRNGSDNHIFYYHTQPASHEIDSMTSLEVELADS